MKLPEPKKQGNITVEAAIYSRRTVRDFQSKALTPEQLSQLLWAAQGITDPKGFKRAAPSGGALYPLDTYAVVGEKGVHGIPSGIYHYLPARHDISSVARGNYSRAMAGAAWSQTWMAGAPVNIVVTAEYSRICGKYGERGVRYAMIEAGHVGQNIFLQAQGLGLEAGIVGAFDDDRLVRVLELPEAHRPLLAMPVGYRTGR